MAGPKVIETPGVKATVAVAVLVASARLEAVTVTVCGLLILAGAVYRPPLEIEPTGGLMDHAALVLPDPVTVAVNC